jgi:hypothetical protein
MRRRLARAAVHARAAFAGQTRRHAETRVPLLPIVRQRSQADALCVEMEFVLRRAGRNVRLMRIVREGLVLHAARREHVSLESIQAVPLPAIGKRTPGPILGMDLKIKTLATGFRATNGNPGNDGNRASQR